MSFSKLTYKSASIISTVSLLASLALANTSSAAELKTLGHYDLNIGFTNGVGWQFNILDFSDDSRIPTRTIDLGVTEVGKMQRLPASEWSPLGIDSGETFWQLPQTMAEGLIFLGYATEDIDPEPFLPFFGNPFISLEMIGVRGSGIDRGGHFSMYQSDAFGSPDFQFTTSDGVGNNDIRSPIPVPAHAHFNWAFTQPGEYHVTFRTEATMTEPANDGVVTNGVGAFTFFVPGSPNLHVLDDGEIDIEVGFAGGVWSAVDTVSEQGGPLSISNVLAYAGANAKIMLPADSGFSGLGNAGDDFWVLPQQETMGLAALGFDADGVMAGVFESDTVFLQLKSIQGPAGGNLAIYQTDGFGAHTVLVNSGNGIDPMTDRIPLSAGNHAHHSWGFTKTGYYELTISLIGTPTGTSQAVESDSFVLRVGVETYPGFRDLDGNRIDDHWEARHGFQTPADPMADPDMDNRSNLVEYLHDTSHDAADGNTILLRLMSASASSAQLEFDTLEGRQYQVFYTDDLVMWKPATARIIGGRLLQRITDDGSGLTATPPGAQRFYRLDITSPQ